MPFVELTGVLSSDTRYTHRLDPVVVVPVSFYCLRRAFAIALFTIDVPYIRIEYTFTFNIAVRVRLPKIVSDL